MSYSTSRLDNFRSLQVANWDVAFATAFATLVTGNFLIGLIKHFDGTDLWIGLATGVPSFIGLVQVPGAIWGKRFPYYKKFIAPGGWVWRLLYAPLIALPFLPIPNEAKLFLLVLCIGLAATAIQLVNPIYNDWLAELVPSTSRGWYFSRRTMIATAVGVVAGFAGGIALDAFRSTGQEGTGFAFVFGAGFVFAILSMIFFLRMKESVRTNVSEAGLRESVRAMSAPWQDKNFRLILIFAGVYMASQTFPGGFFTAFALESLQISFTMLQLIAVMHAVGTIAFVRTWGYLSDKYGNKPILTLTAACTVLTPLIWIACDPSKTAMNATILLVGHIFNGIIWSGVAVTQLNLYMATAKTEDRSSYLGTALTVTAICGGIAPLLGSWVLSSLREPLGTVSAYKALFSMTIVIRAFAVFLLAGVREEGATSIRKTIGQIRKVSFRGVRALRDMSNSDTDRRLRAISDVGHTKFMMASSELRKALSDPSPRIRREAALALTKIGGRDAIDAILSHMSDHPELLDDDMVEALGGLKSQRVEAALVGLLQDPRSVLRRAAAKALGRIGSQQAIPHLIEAAEDKDDVEIRRAVLQALRHLGANEADALILDALTDPHPSVRTAAAEAASELAVPGAAEVLRQSIKEYRDQALPEVAYALGCVGDLSDIEEIVRAAQESQSDPGRRRCLLGAAKLLGVEPTVYRLLLAEHFERDSAMLASLKSSDRKSQEKLSRALDTFSNGDESGAISLLLRDGDDEPLLALRNIPVEESFLVVWAAHTR